jgi:Ser-tRNA(Ala) deacylase AlaX
MRVMRKVFWDNPYQTELITRVLSVEGNRLVFEETIAYSFAYINGMLVIDSKLEGLVIYYTLPEGHGLNVGDTVTMTIDWPRRYKLMGLHFAAELILEIVTRKFGFKKIGAHIAESKARIDFVTDHNVAQLFDEILAEYNSIITSDKLIHKGFSDRENHRRFWKIEGFAEVPCGGTHVKSTAEVGFVALKRERLGKSKERIEIRLI